MKYRHELMTTTDDSSYITPSYIYNKVAEVARDNLVGRGLCAMIAGPSDIPGSTLTLPLENSLSGLDMAKVAEGAEFPIGEATLTSRDITPSKFAKSILITKEVMEDGKFSMADIQINAVGYKVAQNEDTQIWTAAYNNAGSTIDAGTSVGYDDLVNAKAALSTNLYTPTDIVVSPTVKADLENIAEFSHAQEYGAPAAAQKGLVDTILGLNVHVSQNVNISTTYDAFVIDRKNALVLAEKRPLTVVEQELPNRDAMAYHVSHRVAGSYLFANAISRIYST